MNLKYPIYAKDRLTVVSCDEILCLEASGAYSVLVIKHGGTVTISKNFSKVLSELPEGLLFKVSQSAAIRLSEVKYIHYSEKVIELNHGGKVKYTIKKNELDAALKRSFSYE